MNIFLNRPYSASFTLYSSYKIQLTVNVQYKFLAMTGFELQTSEIGSNCSNN